MKLPIDAANMSFAGYCLGGCDFSGTFFCFFYLFEAIMETGARIVGTAFGPPRRFSKGGRCCWLFLTFLLLSFMCEQVAGPLSRC